MKKSRFVIIKISVISMIGFIWIQGIKSQTLLKLNVVQPSELIADAGSDVSIDAGFSTIIGGSPTATGGTGSLTYMWLPSEYLNDETLGNPTAQPPGNLTFNVTVTDERGCTATDEILVSVVGGTFTGEAEDLAILRIYPNPTSGIFTISIEKAKSTEIQISLVNISGQVVYQDIIKNKDAGVTTDVDISGLSKGSYFLRINGDFESIYRQIILK
jgi:hypothetical protein